MPEESVLSYAILTVACYGGLIWFGLKAYAEYEAKKHGGDRHGW